MSVYRFAACLFALTLVLFGALLVRGQEASSEAEPPLEFRSWTDSTGKYKIDAVMVNVASGEVTLKKRDDSVVTVPFERLSSADKSYVMGRISRRAASRRTPRAEHTSEDTAESPAEPAAEMPSALPVADEWPYWRGPMHDGKSLDTGLLKEWPPEGPRLIWKSDQIGQGFSNVTVSDGVVYTSGDVDGKLTIFAFDDGGNLKWKTAHDNAWTKNYPGSRGTPIIDDGRIYIVSGHGLLGCYDAGTGQNLWSRHYSQLGGQPPNWGYAESPLIYGDLVVATPGGSRCLVALDKKTGQPRWTSQGFAAAAQYGSCCPIEYGGARMIVAGTAEGIVCVSAENGRTFWANPFSSHNTANCPTPAFSDGYVFWANGYGKGGICFKLDVLGGRVSAKQAWTTGDMVCHHGGYIIDNGYIYGNHNSGWVCLELETGRKVWEDRGVGKGSVCYADGMLYLFGERGGQVGLAKCTPDGLQLTGSFSVEGEGTSWAHPVVTGGRLYLRYDKNLYCFDVRGS